MLSAAAAASAPVPHLAPSVPPQTMPFVVRPLLPLQQSGAALSGPTLDRRPLHLVQEVAMRPAQKQQTLKRLLSSLEGEVRAHGQSSAPKRPSPGHDRVLLQREQSAHDGEETPGLKRCVPSLSMPLSLDMMDELISKQAIQLRENEARHEQAQQCLRQAHAARQRACQEAEHLQQRKQDMDEKIACVTGKVSSLYKASYELHLQGNDVAALTAQLERQLLALKQFRSQPPRKLKDQHHKDLHQLPHQADVPILPSQPSQPSLVCTESMLPPSSLVSPAKQLAQHRPQLIPQQPMPAHQHPQLLPLQPHPSWQPAMQLSPLHSRC